MAENDWIGGNADWSDATRWSTGVVPDSTTQVVIPSGAATVTDAEAAASVSVPNGGILQGNGSDATPARLTVGGAAGFGSAGVLTGSVNLYNTSAIQFASGAITTIASGAELTLASAKSFVQTAAAPGANSALALSTIDGNLYLRGGAATTSASNLAVGGYFEIQQSYLHAGPTLTTPGTLTVTGRLNFSNDDPGAAQAPNVAVAVGALSNTGEIDLNGSANAPFVFAVQSPAGFGTAGSLTGSVNLNGFSSIRFASGAISTIAASSELTLNSAHAFLATTAAPAANSALALAEIDGSLYLRNGAATAAPGALAIAGYVEIDDSYLAPGPALTAGAVTITNRLNLFNDDPGAPQAAHPAASFASLANTGELDLNGSANAPLRLAVAAPAGLGTVGTLTGAVNLNGVSSLQFASGAITTIASGASLTLFDATAFIETAAAPGSNSALALAHMDGSLSLRNGAAIASADLSVTNYFEISNAYAGSGPALTVSGTLTNSGRLNFANDSPATAQAAGPAVTAGALSNTGRLDLNGTANAPFVMTVATPAGFGTAGSVTGEVNLLGVSELRFAGGAIVDVAKNAQLTLASGTAFLDRTGAAGSNSALNLQTVEGTLYLRSGALATSTGALVNAGLIGVDDTNSAGGSVLTVQGLLTNSGRLNLGNGNGYYQSAGPATLNAQSLSNSGEIDLQGSTPGPVLLNVASAAGFGTAGVLTGSVNIHDLSELRFANSAITQIAANSELTLDGPHAFLDRVGATGSNSALDLSSIKGSLFLRSGAIASNGALTNDGALNVDEGGFTGGSTVTIAGVLTNTNTVRVGSGGGYGALTASSGITAGGLSNTGTITLNGSFAGATASLTVNAPAGFGTVGALSGHVDLLNDAFVKFASGRINTIAASSELTLDGAKVFVEDATATGSNSALDLSSIQGGLYLRNGTVVASSGAVTNAGTIGVDEGGFTGGATLTIAGVLTNTNQISVGSGGGYGALAASSGITAGGLSNTGTIALNGSFAGATASLTANSAAGFGTAGVLTGNVDLHNDAFVKFTSGKINRIAAASELTLDGTKVFVEQAGATGSNSALDLATIEGGLYLRNGTVVASSGALTNDGTIGVDEGGFTGAATMTIAGVLTNTNQVKIGSGGGYGALTASSGITAGGLANTGTITLNGSLAGATASLAVNAAAGFGTAGVLSGAVDLFNDAVVKFASGKINRIAASSELTLNGTKVFVEDATATGSNSALDLSTLDGRLYLRNGVAVASSGGLTNNSTLGVDEGGFTGGSTLTIAGVLTNAGATTIGSGNGYGSLTAAATVRAGGLSNTGTINVNGSAAALALLDVTSAATGITGAVNLGYNGALRFASGVVADIASGSELTLGDATSRVATATAPGSNSALNLATIEGGLYLRSGAAVTSSGALNNDGGVIGVDESGFTGGSTLNIVGVLTNSGRINVASGNGYGANAVTSTIDAGGLVNSGTLNLYGSAAAQAVLHVTGAGTNSGRINLGAFSTLDVTGGLTQTGDTIVLDGELDAPTLTIQAGTLAGAGTLKGNLVETGGPVHPGDPGQPGVLTITGDYTQGAGGDLVSTITGTDPAQVGHLVIGGALSLNGGTLTLDPESGFSFALGETFTLATFAPGSLTGTFGAIVDGPFTGSVNSVNIAGGLSINIGYDNAGGKITATVAPSPSADDWKGGSGLWTDSNSWTAGVPVATSAVTIGDTASGFVQFNVANASVANLTVTSGNTLEVLGGETLDVAGGASLTGALLVDNGATLEYGANASGVTTFNGAGGVIRLDAPQAFTGTIGHFSPGDAIVLTNTNATSATLTGTALTVALASGGSLTLNLDNTIPAGDGFIVTRVGADSRITVASPPVVNAPGAQNVVAGIASQIPAISVADANAGAGVLTVKIVAGAGTLAAAAVSGGTVSGGGTNAVTLTGTVVQINAELVGLTYTGAAAGADTLNVAIRDALGASAAAAIAINNTPMPSTVPVLEAPSIGVVVPGQENGIPGLKLSDPYAEATGQQVTVTFSAGEIPQTFVTSGAPGATVTGQGTDHLTITGTVAQINAYLQDGVTEQILQAAAAKALEDAKKAGEEYDKLVEQYGKFYEYLQKGLNLIGGPELSLNSELTQKFLKQFGKAVAQVDVGLFSFAANVLNEIVGIASNSPPSPPPGGGGGGSGAHILTYDGLLYQLDSQGEFLLTGATSASDSFTVEARLQPVAGSQSASAITQIALLVGTDRVTLDATRAATVWENGAALTFGADGLQQLNGGQIRKLSAATYQVTWNTGEILTVTDEGSYLDVKVGLGANNGPGSVIGLMGPDQGQSQDFQLPDGTVLAQPLSQAGIANFANFWRVPQGLSLFDYGAGETTATYTNLSFPTAPVSLADFPAAVVSKARAAVAAAGILDAGVADAAALDYILSGGDPAALTADQNLFQGFATTPVTVAPGAPTPAVLGVIAAQDEVPVAAAGATSVTFDLYLTKPVAADTVVDYAVIAPTADDLDAADFGGTLPSGTVTIAANSVEGHFTISVPQGALGSDPSDKVEVRITTPGSTAVVVGTASATITTPQPGAPPVPQLADLTPFGTFIHDGGNHYTLDLGAVQYGEPIPTLQFAIANGATGRTDQLGGTFSIDPVEGFTVSGAALPSPLNAGQSYQGLTATVNTIKFGNNVETIVFHPVDTNASGFSSPLPDITLTILDTLEVPGLTYSQAWGDVHIVTYNGLTYDFQASGEYILARSQVPGDTFEIDLELAPWFTGASVSVIKQVAIQIGADTATFDWSRPNALFVDHVATPMSIGQTLAVAGGVITEVSPDVFRVDWSTGEMMTVTNAGSYINVIDGVPASDLAGGIAGLQGEGEGKENDFQLADGTILPQPISQATLYGPYAASWQVGPAKFDGPTTANTPPANPLTLADFPADVVANAQRLVAAAGVTDPAIANAAALDFIATGDPSFIASAKTAQDFQPVATSTPTVTGAAPSTALGVMAVAQRVTAVAGGVTPVTFTVYLTAARATATTVDYTVISPDAGDFTAAQIGAAASGQVTIGANATEAQFTINVPNGALGARPDAVLDVQISDGAGVAVFAATAQTDVVNSVATPSLPAVPKLSKVGGGGTLAFDAATNTYTLDLGTLTQGSSQPDLQFLLANAATAPADDLGGTFTPPLGDGFLVRGNDLAAPIAAAKSYSGLYYAIDTATLGAHSETMTFAPRDQNDSGFSAALPTITLIVKDNIAKPAIATLNSPTQIVFPNVRVGTPETRLVSITNSAAAGAESLDVAPVPTGAATATGAVSLLAPGATDTTHLSVGLDTSAAGAFSGFVGLNASSDNGAGGATPLLPTQVIDVFGSVYNPASASVAGATAFVHVGDTGSLKLKVTNTAAAGAYTEALVASLKSATGAFSVDAAGPTADIAPGASDATTLSVGFQTTAAGTFSGAATLALFTDGGTGVGSIDGLGQLALPDLDAPVSVTVNNYALAAIQETAGGGTFSQAGNAYAIDLGRFAQNSGPVTVALSVLNTAAGPADLLSGTFSSPGGAAFTNALTGVSGIAAGGSAAAGTVTFSTSASGHFSETITLSPTGSNASGYSAALAGGDETITITGDVDAAPTPPSTPIDVDAAANAVLENAVDGAAVGLTASSTSASGPVTYSLTNSANGAFTIDALSGVVTVADASKLDYETTPGHAYTITVQAGDGRLTSSADFTIAVTDVAPSAPTDADAAVNTVAENVVNGALVGITAASTDPHGPAVAYSLTNSANGAFAIDPSTGVVTVADASKLDYETAPGHAYTITVKASDGTLASTSDFTIAVTNVAPSAPTDADAAVNTVAENAASGALVGITAASTDPHGPPVVYSLTNSANGAFAIDPSTGVVTVADASKLDYETALGHAYTITVQASDGALTSSGDFTISVTNVAPSSIVDANAAANTVAEDAAAGTTVGITAASTDPHGPPVVYSLTNSSNGAFAIDPATGVVTVADASKLDYETAPGHAYTITVQASDGALTSSGDFTIAVTNVAPSAPTDADAAANTVAEGAAAGSVVGVTAFSNDPHGPAVVYSLTNSANGAFAIDPATGVVTVADPSKVDFESAPGHAYSITVQASDGALTSSADFAIAVANVAPSLPTDADAAPNTVADGAAAGTTVGLTASSSDPNGPAVSYSIVNDTSGGGFTIDPATGVVTIANPTKVRYAASGAAHAFSLTVAASDGALSSQQTFDVTIAPPATIAPPTLALSPASDSGVSASDRITNVVKPTVTGAADTGDTVTIYDTDGTTVLGTGVAAAGAYSIPLTTALTQGAHTLTAKASNGGGLVSDASAPLGVTIDTTPPTVVVSSDESVIGPTSPPANIVFTFSEPVAGFTSSDLLVTGGTLSALVQSAVSPDVYSATFTPAAGASAAAGSIQLPAGAYTDVAGNAGGAGSTSFVVSTAPAVVTITSPGGVTTSASQVVAGTLAGALGASPTVQLYDGDTAIGDPVAVDASGAWTTTIALPHGGDNVVTARDTNAADGAAPSNAVTFTLNQPAAPSAPTHAVDYIEALYDGLLGRSCTPLEDFAWNLQIFATHPSAQALADAFLTSPEYQSKFGSFLAGSSDDFVNQLYSTALHRTPGDDGQVWIDELNGGVSREAVALSIAWSGEHFTNMNNGLFN